MQEHETFFTLLKDAAHWEFELLLMFIFDIVIGLIFFPFLKKHWRHHIESDALHGFDDVEPSNKHIWIMKHSLCVCKKCGIVKRKDGKNSPCKDIVKVALRGK